MNTVSIVEDLEELLSEERDAIVRLDGGRVASLADAKLRLAQALEGRPLAERVSAAPQVRRVVRRLKGNGVLLAHARAILAEVTTGVAGGMGARTSSGRPRRLSIRA